MRFRTEIELSLSDFRIDHNRIGFMVGSCFSQHIADRLIRNKFNVTANPTGILFNPESIAALISRLSDGTLHDRSELFCRDGMWYCYDTHGVFASGSADDTLTSINDSLRHGAEALQQSHYIIFTLGTAWVYRLKSTGRVVANCHKQPAHLFDRQRLTALQIEELFAPLLRGPLANKQVLFTVSPVRHLRDGLAENSLSKATLRCAVDALQQKFANVRYFPAFEIMNDDLRDYRFYADDMLHPSAQAVEYVWKKFTDFAMDTATRSLLPKLDRLAAAMQHRILHSSDSGVEAFRHSSLRLIDELQQALPTVDFGPETQYFSQL